MPQVTQWGLRIQISMLCLAMCDQGTVELRMQGWSHDRTLPPGLCIDNLTSMLIIRHNRDRDR